ncbi:uncharacterized protein LOC143257857 [Tachypleus tridentatus]|uniref:uncharacterized protein LOC143257857 n=1 Tax=Tachypleus tridentatus TaxID=6853 RepID=UPI003FD23A5E
MRISNSHMLLGKPLFLGLAFLDEGLYSFHAVKLTHSLTFLDEGLYSFHAVKLTYSLTFLDEGLYSFHAVKLTYSLTFLDEGLYSFHIENASDRPVSVVQTEAKNSSASLRSGPDPEYKVCMLAFEEDCSMMSEGSSTNRKEEEAQPSLARETFVTPKEALKTKEFYLFILTFISSVHSTMFVTSFYKTYGQTFIDDDIFLATTGSASAIVHAVLRLVMGLIQDKLFFKTTNLILMGLKTVLLFTLVATPYGGKVMFIMWICALYATFPVEFVCIPAAVAEVFGKKHTAMIYGMIYFSSGTSVIIWPLIFQVIIPYFGWFGTFCLIGSISLIGRKKKTKYVAVPSTKQDKEGFLTSFVYPENYHTQPPNSSVCNDKREQTLYGTVVWQK